MDVEDIKGKPGLEEKSPWNGNKKTQKKTTPSSSVTSNRVTLTRFLGPFAPPSLAQWKDINRECPVCKRKGFSSRGLEVHVNECLDNELNRGISNGVVSEHSKLEASGNIGRDRKASAADFGSQNATKVKRALAVAEHPGREDVDVKAKSTAPKEKRLDSAITLPTICLDESKKRPKTQQSPKVAHGVQKEGAMKLLVDVEGGYSLQPSPRQHVSLGYRYHIFLTMLICNKHARNA